MDESQDKFKGSIDSVKDPLISDDREQRKLTRRLRIQRRLEEAARLRAIQDGTYAEPEPEKTPFDQAVEDSEDVLETLLLEGKELVSNIRVASDAREVERREIELEDRNKRLQMLEEEAALALEKLNEITNRWELMKDVNDPLNLNDHMKEQKAKCLELIQQKNDLIKNFQDELKLADEKYMKDRRKMLDDLSLLTQRIDEQVLVMKKAYRVELKNIEGVVDATRSKMLADYQKTWQSLYNKRENCELSNVAKKFSMVESHEAQLEELHKDHEEKYRETRIKLETDVQTLEQELERVKALCLLNSEKLDYNYQVLRKREEENVYIKNHQKRKLNKLQDLVNQLKKKIDDKQSNTELELKRLHQEVLRYHGNVMHIEKKAAHFAQMNDERYREIWEMKDQEAREKLNKILSIDKIIYEQILGIPWSTPQVNLLNKKELPSYVSAQKVVTQLFSKTDEVKHNIDVGDGDLPENKKIDFEEGHRRVLRNILGMIADQSGFLIDEKLDELLRPYTTDEKTLVRLDNVFTAIGIQTERDVELVKNIFLPYAMCPLCESKKPSEDNVVHDVISEKVHEELHHTPSQSVNFDEKYSKFGGDNSTTSFADSIKTLDMQAKTESADQVQLNNKEDTDARVSGSQCNITHPLVIEKIYVLNALKDLVAEFYSDSCNIPAGMSFRLSKQRNTISRLLENHDVENYWNRFKEIFIDTQEKLWDTVFIALHKYYALLQERHRLNLKAQKIRRQNLELAKLLSSYVTDEADKAKLLLPHLSREKRNMIDIYHLNDIITRVIR